jgi:hypothetical protein
MRVHSSHPSTCSPPSFFLLSHPNCRRLSRSLAENHQHCSQVPLLTQPGGFHLRSSPRARRGTKPNRCEAKRAQRREDIARAVSIFCHPGARFARARAADLIGPVGRSLPRVYVDL